ncbi:MAG: gliding motility lipoprotein GldH [Prolixibacteraceae bacterium]|nr:gliding motility lipoprotein GldH [Prolixibacteraceae bacterium]
MIRNTAVVVAAFCLMIASCNTGCLYEDYRSFGNEGWDKDSLISFNVQVTDTAPAFDINIYVRNLGDYQYSNLWLFAEVQAPDSSVIRDTVEYVLAKPNGEWTGKGNTVFSNNFIFRENVYFPRKGIYTFTLQQAMREDKLKGISDIGLRVEKN